MNKNKVLVTGSDGFIGKNLISRLEYLDNYEVFAFDRKTDKKLLGKYCKECDVVVHLAGVNRTTNPGDFKKGNEGFTETLIFELEKNKNNAPIIFSGSIHAEHDTDYGKSKKQAENVILKHAKLTGAKTYLFRLTNVFGKWCKPNYNSAIATFCHNIANGLPIVISDENIELTLVYIDDVVDALIDAINGKTKIENGFCIVETQYKFKLGAIVNLIKSFEQSRSNLVLPIQTMGSFEKKLYSTYTSYLPVNALSYSLKMNIDERGSFTEFLKTHEFGQISINVSRPGVIRGNHWHQSKNEKFLVVAGSGAIRVWERGKKDNYTEYLVSGDKLEVVDIPCGLIHNIANTGKVDLVTVVWVNEIFNQQSKDTYSEETRGNNGKT